jgi:predicted nucleic acid-binding protein
VILVDVNLLVEATMTSARDHEAARSWLQDRLSGTARVGLPWASITGFVCVVGQPRVWERPLPVDGAPLGSAFMAIAPVRVDTGAGAAASRHPRHTARSAAVSAARHRRASRGHRLRAWSGAFEPRP